MSQGGARAWTEGTRPAAHLKGRRILLLCTIVAALPLVSPLQAQTPQRLVLDSASSRVWLEGHATLGHFTAETRTMRGWAELTEPGRFEGGSGSVEVDVASLHTGIGLRDRHLRGEMDVEHYPHVVFAVNEVAQAEPYPAELGWTGESVLLHGTLTVKGSEHPISFPAAAELRGDTLHVQGKLPLHFTELGMKPPTKLLGSVRVADDFTLLFDARFLPARP